MITGRPGESFCVTLTHTVSHRLTPASLSPLCYNRPAGKDPEWFLEIDSGDIDTRADSTLNYVADPGQRRVTFAATGGLWSLRFPVADGYRAFITELEVSGGRGWHGRLQGAYAGCVLRCVFHPACVYMCVVWWLEGEGALQPAVQTRAAQGLQCANKGCSVRTCSC